MPYLLKGFFVKRSFYLLAIAIFSVSFLICAHQKNAFLIDSKSGASTRRLSKNRLKENIGSESKTLLYKCVSISHKLGFVQQKLALLENRLISDVERLVGNDHPFKRAGRNDLSQAAKIVADASTQLDALDKQISEIVTQMQKSVCLKQQVCRPCVAT